MGDISKAIRPFRSAVGRLVREAALYPTLARRRAGRRVAFLPSGTRQQSSLLRAWNVADGLAADHGWSTLVVPPQLGQSQRRRLLSLFQPDIVVVQQCRHPLNRLPYLREWPFVLDVDDADFLDASLSDVLAGVAQGSLGVICGSRYIRDWADRHAAATAIVWTGTPASLGPWPDHAKRAPIVTWAQSSVSGYPAEYDFVRKVIASVAARRGGLEFRIYGWDLPDDHSTLAQLRAAGVAVETRSFMSYRDFLQSLREVSVGLSPLSSEGFSLGKSFGKILAYLDAKVPVVCSDAADHGLFFDAASAVVSNETTVWVDRICALLDDPSARTKMSDAAHAAFKARLSTEAAVREVDRFLQSVLSATEGSTIPNSPL